MSTLASLDNDEVMLEFYLTQRIVMGKESDKEAKRLVDFGETVSQIDYLIITREYEFALSLITKYGRFINDKKIGDFNTSLMFIRAMADTNNRTAFILFRELIKAGVKIEVSSLYSLFSNGANDTQISMLKYVFENGNLSENDKEYLLKILDNVKADFPHRSKDIQKRFGFTSQDVLGYDAVKDILETLK